MATYRHGVYVTEQATGTAAPREGTAGLQVVVGTAPVHLLDDPAAAVNTPILVSTYKEAVAAVGYSDDFSQYTLCEAIAASFQVVGVAPLVLINVLDPAKHTTTLAEATVAVTDGVAVVEQEGVLLSELKVLNGETELEADVDYTAVFNSDGTVSLVLLEDGAGAGAASLTVSGKVLDAGAVTADDIVGGVDANTGAETGLEVVRQVYPKLGLTPGILTAPRWSSKAAVSAALQAKTEDINGVFRCVCMVDLDSSADGAVVYTAVQEQKEAQGVTDPNVYAVWGYGKVGDALYSGSSLAAALTAYTDAENSDIPYVSPSNKDIGISALCLEDGTEVLLDQEQANVINSGGAATFLNLNGFRLWGNNTACYPENADTKDRFLSCRRYLSWRANSFILTYFQKVDSPLNKRLIDAVVDSENVRGNGYVAIGAAARDEIAYLEDENSTDDLLNGKITFHQYITPFPPAEDIEDIIEFDPDALSAALS